jgi:ABC-type branched-subunit amino acid transport system permease subunit
VTAAAGRLAFSNGTGWLVALVLGSLVPTLLGTPYYMRIAITACIYITLAVSFDLVVGRIGALSLAQPLFFGFGSYAGALLNTHYQTGFLSEVVAAAALAAVLALLIGIPSFRLSLHSFAIGTLGFLTIGQLIAQNWISVTKGTLCMIGIAPLRLHVPGATLVASTLTQQYYVIFAIAVFVVGLVFLISRVRLGTAFTAVKEDPTLAAARGLWPTELRLTAFSISAAMSAAAGVFAAHFQAVVCPNALDFSYMSMLLIMVFVGGRGSLRGVVLAAVAFTIIPEALRLTAEWRLAIYGAILLAVVTTFPDGFEHLLQGAGSLGKRVTDTGSRVPRAEES